MKKICISLMLLFCCVFAAVAMPAKPGWHTLKQSDGTTLTVQAVGNAFNHALLTSDGLMVALGDDGDFYYRSSLTGLTSVRAHEAKDRTATENAFIAAQRSNLTMQQRVFTPKKGVPTLGVGGSNAEADVPAQGTRKVPIILVEFKDKKFKNTREQLIQAMLTGNTSVQQYFKDQSNGKTTPTLRCSASTSCPRTASTMAAMTRAVTTSAWAQWLPRPARWLLPTGFPSVLLTPTTTTIVTWSSSSTPV